MGKNEIYVGELQPLERGGHAFTDVLARKALLVDPHLEAPEDLGRDDEVGPTPRDRILVAQLAQSLSEDELCCAVGLAICDGTGCGRVGRTSG